MSIVCPHCGGRIPVVFDRGKRAPVELACPYCGARLQVEATELTSGRTRKRAPFHRISRENRV